MFYYSLQNANSTFNLPYITHFRGWLVASLICRDVTYEFICAKSLFIIIDRAMWLHQSKTYISPHHRIFSSSLVRASDQIMEGRRFKSHLSANHLPVRDSQTNRSALQTNLIGVMCYLGLLGRVLWLTRWLCDTMLVHFAATKLNLKFIVQLLLNVKKYLPGDLMMN